MIPLHLRIVGFLSYRDPTELDFTTFDLACISGHNGAGKSSLLDAITWVLFGEARGKSTEIINLHQDVKAAEVSLVFDYEGSVYRVQRSLPRNKSTILEFQIQNGSSWKALTERTTRETQARIQQTLRLDYDTFVNASFFLQGRADQFTQQNASKRKEVLGAILGLEVWDAYKERTAARRKMLEVEESSIEGRMEEIEAELAEEDARKARLKELQASLKQVSAARHAQEGALEGIQRAAAGLIQQRRLVETLSNNLKNSQAALTGLLEWKADREAELAAYTELVSRQAQIEADYRAWVKARNELRKQDSLAAQFRFHDDKRQPLLRAIEAERARLEQELSSLEEQSGAIHSQLELAGELERKIEIARHALAETETKIQARSELENQAVSTRERLAELKAENERLRLEMEELKSRIDRLQVAEGATCPLCGQALSEAHRKSTLEALQLEGTEKGDGYRSNMAKMRALAEELTDVEADIDELARFDGERLHQAGTVSQLTERFDLLRKQSAEWEQGGATRLLEVKGLLESGQYALPARAELAQLDQELASLGYDVSQHETARQREAELHSAEEDHHDLKTALAVSRQYEDELSNLNQQIANLQSRLDIQQNEYERAVSALAEAETNTPNLDEAERELFSLREQENLIRDEVGMARQRVDVLETLRARKMEYAAQRRELHKGIAQHKTLERAFGKDGVPALLIEQALPQIESRANDLLDRLSDGQMSIRFATQAEYKDKKRDDLKETLDILISDTTGTRDYQMYSGGEAFRVNFAIRLALSEILAQRKGARLQTLVIDEGFGSQDTQGRQRLIEAINLVQHDFAKILVITHLDELKDAFPARIEVEKTARGSIVKVI